MIDELLDLPIPHKMNQAMINYLGTKKWSFVGDLDKKYQPSFYDHNIGKSVSAVYSFHTNDGGTQVENEFASSKEGQAVVFKSEKKHKGITTKTSNFRLNLNIVMELE